MNPDAWIAVAFIGTVLWYALAYGAFFNLHRYGPIDTPLGAFLWWLVSPIPPVCLVVVWYWIGEVARGMFGD